MAKQIINIGSSANSGTGDPLRTSFNKTNENFTELYNAVDTIPSLGAFKIQGNTLGTSDEGNSWGGTDMNLSPNGEGNTWIYIPNDANAVAGASFVIGNNTNNGGGIQLNAGGNNWTFASNGDLTAPGDITTGTVGGRFIQDCDDGATAMRWINVNQGSTSTQLIRAYTGDPKLDTEVERAQIRLNWQGEVDNEALSGLTIRSFDQTDPNNGVDHDWLFKGDGILQLPVGGDIVDAEGNSVLNAVTTVNPLYLMANVDGNISTSTDGTTWSSSIDTGISIGTVAIGPNKIVYTRADVNQDANNTGLYSSSRASVPPTLIEGTNGNPGGDLYWFNVEYFEGATYPWVAVGYQDSDLKRPTLIYSSDGISWDFADINLESVYNTTNLEFTDVAYGNGYYVITARGDNNPGGMWVTQDLTQTIAVSTNQLSGIEVNFKFIEYFTEQNGFHKWNAVATNNQWWATSDNNPAAYEEWSNLFDEGGLAGIIEEETNLANVTIEEFASGQIDGYSYWMASSGSGHIIWWPNAPTGPFVSIPQPYTATVSSITDSATAVITYTGQQYQAIGEKFVISGSSVDAYNGTYYIGADGAMFTDFELTIPFDTSAIESNFTGTATITWSHGTYIDSLGHANNAFYAGNDDEEIFKGQFGEGLYWTKVDDKNNSLEYWNDFGYYPEFGSGGNNELTNGLQTLSLENDGTVTLPAGGTITEGVVTNNPTLQLTPASPTVASQKLVIKGGGQYSSEDNGIFLTWNEINPQVTDTVTIYVGASGYTSQTLYWWIHPAEANIADPGVGTVEIDGSGNGSFTFTVDSDDYEFTVRVSPEENNYDPASIGVETLVFNEASPTFGDHHLHLTTGDLTETSIFLGTDDHNVRTTTDGSIQITTPNETNNVWSFDNEGGLTFPDNTVQTTAYTGGGTATGVSRSDDNLIIRLTDPNDDGLELRSIVVDGNDADVASTVLGSDGFIIRTNSTVSQKQWQFANDGTTTFPGALVKSTVAKTGVVYPTTTGTAETLSTSPAISGLTDGTYGPFTLGVVTFSVLVVGGIINGITNLTSTGDVTVGDNLGTINSGDIGGIPGATSITITVSTVVQETPTSLDLTKSINKLTDGSYSLADGVEGQIMYLVRSPNTSSLDVFVTVANGEGENPLYPFNKYNSDETAVVPNDGICTLIFTDGSWKQTGGLWD
jgi:hypothetical protein